MAADKKKPLDSLLLPLPHSLSSPLFSPHPQFILFLHTPRLTAELPSLVRFQN